MIFSVRYTQKNVIIYLRILLNLILSSQHLSISSFLEIYQPCIFHCCYLLHVLGNIYVIRKIILSIISENIKQAKVDLNLVKIGKDF